MRAVDGLMFFVTICGPLLVVAWYVYRNPR